MLKNGYDEVFGTWEVTTEGDVEGRTTKNLGNFTGYIDEIALYLANKCYYSLHFKKVVPITSFQPTGSKVSVQLDISSGTWDNNIHSEKGLNEIRKVFAGRPVKIEDSNFYASFIINSDNEEIHNEILRKSALSKLTDDEKKVLGLK